MQPNIGNVITAMIDYNYGCPELMNHALKVYAFSKGIGEEEQISPERLETLEIGAVLHDIGIRISEEKYQAFSGKYQQIEGPAIARELLTKIGYGEAVIERVCFLIAHHHEYDAIDAEDYQILVEADFLVNLYEEGASRQTIAEAKEKIFRTKAGTAYLENLFQREYPKASLFRAALEETMGKYNHD